MSKINVSTETLRGVNEEIEAITEALIQNKTELKNLMEQINNKIASDEVKPRLVAYGEILEEVCKNTNQTLASLKEYLGNQIEKYERIDAETREKLASEARILEQLETEDGGGTATAAGAAAVAGGAALTGGGNEDTTAQAQTTGDTSTDTNVAGTSGQETFAVGKTRITNVSTDEKITTVLEKYGLSQKELDIVAATAIHEAAGNNKNAYEEVYNVTSTIMNRGANVYKQVIAPSQFSSYGHGHYKQNINISHGSNAYQAVLDALYSGVPSHNYKNFRSNGSKSYGGTILTSGGNRYK